MSNMLEGLSPVTQTIKSGKALAKFLGLSEELPETISLANGARLVLSSKRDAYYMTTSKGCSCRAGQYGQMCKHRKATESQSTKRLFAKPGGFILPEEEERAVSSPVSKMLIDAYAPTVTPDEIAYWQRKAAEA